MGAAASLPFVRARRRFYKYGSQYFDHHILPRCRDLLLVIQVSAHPDASYIFDAFVKIGTCGSGTIDVVEFHRFFGWTRGVFTERIFELYSKQEKSLSKETIGDLSFNEFLVCIWNYCSYDAYLMAKYVFNIFDIDRLGHISMKECDAMLRMIYYNPQNNCDGVISAIKDICGNDEVLDLEPFLELVVADNSIIQPAFDFQSRIVKRIGCGDSCWEKYRKTRRIKYGTDELPAIEY